MDKTNSRADDPKSDDNKIGGDKVFGETMRKVVKLNNQRGLHARASAKFCACAAEWDAEIRVHKDGYTAGGCSIMGLLTLGAGMGEEIEIEASGRDAKEAVETLCKLIENKFGEEE